MWFFLWIDLILIVAFANENINYFITLKIAAWLVVITSVFALPAAWKAPNCAWQTSIADNSKLRFASTEKSGIRCSNSNDQDAQLSISRCKNFNSANVQLAVELLSLAAVLSVHKVSYMFRTCIFFFIRVVFANENINHFIPLQIAS